MNPEPLNNPATFQYGFYIFLSLATLTGGFIGSLGMYYLQGFIARNDVFLKNADRIAELLENLRIVQADLLKQEKADIARDRKDLIFKLRVRRICETVLEFFDDVKEKIGIPAKIASELELLKKDIESEGSLIN